MSPRLVVLASGTGTNLAAILTACANGALDAHVVGVASDVDNAGAIRRATDAHIPTAVVEPRSFHTRVAFDHALAEVVAAWQPDLVVLAGFLRIVGNEFLARFPHRVVNLHPALPGELPGLHAIERAYRESRESTRTTTGVMVHFVPDEGVDCGPVIATCTVRIYPDDTLETFASRMHETEHRVLIEALAMVLAERAGTRTIYSEEHQR